MTLAENRLTYLLVQKTYNNMLKQNESQALLAFLSRVQLQGNEVDTYVYLRNKVVEMTKKVQEKVQEKETALKSEPKLEDKVEDEDRKVEVKVEKDIEDIK